MAAILSLPTGLAASDARPTGAAVANAVQGAPAGSGLEIGLGSAAGARAAAAHFLAQRGWKPGQRPAAALVRARHLRALELRAPSLASGVAAAGAPAEIWAPVGPTQVLTAAFGKVTGRVSSIAVDPADPSGNTVYLGSTGGGVWKSTNAAGLAGSVTFSALTDSLSGSPSTGAGSLSIGAISVQPGGTGVVLAGTGDPNDALDSYWGSGILRSADGGLTWTTINQSNETGTTQYTSRSFVGLSFAGFAWSSSIPGLVVAAVSESSESVIVNAENAESQVGVYYSTDAGATWLLATIEDSPNALVQSPQLASPTAAAATSVVWNPVRRRFYAAIRFHGYYESVDGITWTRPSSQPGAQLDITSCPSNYSSLSCPLFRGALAVQPVSGDTFAITTDINNINQGVWRDACSASPGSCVSPTVSFQSLPSQPLEDINAVIPQADYDLWLAAVAVPGDTILYAGTEDIFRCSLAAGCAWRNTTNVNTCAAAQVAPAQHAVDASLGGSASSGVPGLIYFGNDGGLWRTTDGVTQAGAPCSPPDAAAFQNLNGGLGSLAEITDVATDPTNPAIILAAQGALGTSAAIPPGQTVWPQVLGGEGSQVAIDPNAPANWFSASASGVSIQSCNQGEACSIAGFGGVIIGSAQVGGDGNALSYPAPWILDPQDTARIIVGTCRVWRGPTTGGSSWSAANDISPFLDGAGPGGSNQVCTSNAVIHSVAASGTVTNLPGGQELIYAGMAGEFDGGSVAAGRIYSAAVGPASGATTPWTDLSYSPVTNDFANNGLFNPGGFDISGMAVDPHDTTGETLYVTIQGFSGNGINEPRVYSSVDGGAHWLNVTGNLPPGPANAVVVDPNDANTVYVALDVGTFYTRQITTCATGNSCWSVFGTALPDAPVTSLTVINGGSGSGVLQAATYGRGVWQTSLPITQTTATLVPSMLTFAAQALSTTSAAQAVVLTNTGSLPLNISQITVSTDYAETNNCGITVAAGAACVLNVTFTPSLLGSRPGTLIVFADIPGGQVSAVLSGTGAAAAAVVPVPTSLIFASLPIGTTSAPQVVTISNTGGITLNLVSETVSGDFQINVNTCTATLAPNSGCSVSITFTPTAAGNRPGVLTIVDDAGTQTVPLTGTGLSAPTDTLSPLSLTFAPQVVNTSSVAQAVTLTNSGSQSLTLIALTVTGDFTLTNGCGNSLIGNSSCVIDVTYIPSRVGAATGVLTVSDALRTQTVTLGGTGLAAALDVVSPLTLVFPAQVLNVASTPQVVTLTDTSVAVLTLISASTTGDFILNSGCTPTLQGHASCGFSVSYLPTKLGPEVGTLLISDANGTQTVTLSGTGVATANSVSANPTSLDFGAVTIAVASAPMTVTFTNQSSAAISALAFAITGDYTIGANNCQSTLAAAASCAVQIVFTPSAPGTRPGTLTASSSTLAGGSLVIPLTGVGQAAVTDTIAPTAIAFGNQLINTASTGQQVTLSNTGSGALTGISVTITGDFTLTNGCGASLAGNSTCTFTVAYLPSVLGAEVGKLTVTDSLHVQTVALSGTGVSATGSGALFTMQTVGAASATITSGQTASYTVDVIPAVGSSGSVALTCSGLPAFASCTLTPVSAALVPGTTVAVAVSIATGIGTSLGSVPSDPAIRASGEGMLVLAAVLPFGLLGWRRKGLLKLGATGLRGKGAVVARTLFILAIAGLLGFGCYGCGGVSVSSSGAGGGGNTTPSGTSTITITGTGGGQVKTVSVTLIVQ